MIAQANTRLSRADVKALAGRGRAASEIYGGTALLGFVTGTSSGVGETFACRLAADGWNLAITARRSDRLSALAQRLTGKHGGERPGSCGGPADPGDITGLERVVAAAEPDLLVNNGRFGRYREFCYVDPQVVPIWLACTCWRPDDWPGQRYRP